MDDYGNSLMLHNRYHLFGYVWWMYGFCYWTHFDVETNDLTNDLP